MSAMVKLVAIDDDPLSLELVREALSGEKLEIHTSTDPEEGFDIVLRERPQVVLLDLMMPNVSGMELLERIVQMDPSIEVVLMTAHYSTESAVEAIKKGASDYVNKPIDIPSFRQRIQKLADAALRRQRAKELDSELMETCQFEGMVGRSPLMWEVFALIQRVAPKNNPPDVSCYSGVCQGEAVWQDPNAFNATQNEMIAQCVPNHQ